MPILGQIFYGRGKNGYGILGVSPSGRPFADAVAALCQSVGSPDRPRDVRPFLLSKRERGHVIMIRACRSEDATGRATLFFHALVAPKDVLASAGLDAFILADKNAFVSALPMSEIEDMPVADLGNPSVSPCSTDARSPAFIASDHPLDAEVRRFLGRETLSWNWATYSYHTLQDFDLCVHSSYAAAPANGNRYVLKGGRFLAISDSSPSQSPSHKDQSMSPLHNFALKASLLANLVLAAILIVSNLRDDKGGGQPKPPSSFAPSTSQSDLQKQDSASEMSEADARAKWEEAWKKEWQDSLRKSFEKRLGYRPRINNFYSEATNIIPYLKQIATLSEDDPRRIFLDRCNIYVSFIESEFPHFTTPPERNTP